MQQRVAAWPCLGLPRMPLLISLICHQLLVPVVLMGMFEGVLAWAELCATPPWSQLCPVPLQIPPPCRWGVNLKIRLSGLLRGKGRLMEEEKQLPSAHRVFRI